MPLRPLAELQADADLYSQIMLQCHANGPTAMDIEKGNKQDRDREDSPIPYLPELGQGEKLAEDEELVADMSCQSGSELASDSLALISVIPHIQPTSFSTMHA